MTQKCPGLNGVGVRVLKTKGLPTVEQDIVCMFTEGENRFAQKITELFVFFLQVALQGPSGYQAHDGAGISEGP